MGTIEILADTEEQYISLSDRRRIVLNAVHNIDVDFARRFQNVVIIGARTPKNSLEELSAPKSATQY